MTIAELLLELADKCDYLIAQCCAEKIPGCEACRLDRELAAEARARAKELALPAYREGCRYCARKEPHPQGSACSEWLG